MKLKLRLLVLFLLISIFGSAQSEFNGTLTTSILLSSSADLPFWFYSNQRGRISEETAFNGLVTGSYTTDLNSRSRLEIGSGVLYNDGSQDNFAIDHLYVDYSYDWFEIVLGRKQQEELYTGLSSTNKNILWSLNARPMYGIKIFTNRTIYLDKNEKFGFRLNWEDYIQNGDVPTNDFVHHKSLHAIVNFSSEYSLKLGLNHFAQWGGVSPAFGEQPAGFSDYLRIISGSGGGEAATAGDQKNALGNHLGSWELYLNRNFKDSKLQLIYNSIFDDASGRRLANFPDGRYGLYWEADYRNNFVTSAIYEFYYTRHQSHNVNYWGADNYLNNGIFSYGWAYKDRVIGSPFFTYDEEEKLIINNKFTAHHIGIGGNLNPSKQSLNYRLLVSYSHNDGTYESKLDGRSSAQDELNTYLQMSILKAPVATEILLGVDYNSFDKPNYGIGINISRQF